MDNVGGQFWAVVVIYDRSCSVKNLMIMHVQRFTIDKKTTG